MKPLVPQVKARVFRYSNAPSEYFQITAHVPETKENLIWAGDMWLALHGNNAPRPPMPPAPPGDELVQLDRRPLAAAGAWLCEWSMRPAMYSKNERWLELRITGRDWPERFLSWLARRPDGLVLELDAELASLQNGAVAGSIRLDIQESKTGMDWFDLELAMDVTDSTLTKAEIDLLLKAKGRWVKLPDKGWRKLQFQLTPEQQQELASLGISADELDGGRHRMHALQMAGALKNTSTLLPAERAAQVQRRIEEIRMDIAPPMPAEITASLRPYQTQGFHFLAFLSANNFGGVLADDMGLGKTLQTLTWLAWLRGITTKACPVLVVCPKSVQENWRSEAARFFPALPVHTWSRGDSGTVPKKLDGLLIIHYAQLRQHETQLRAVKWAAVILDEAQAIKNPTSQTAAAACALQATHRLALTGIPVENRLMDLWSIFAFAMPGLLGTRASFNRQFDSKTDPLARRRLAARTRPFLLRRTKKEVASDLPERVEEDVLVELEGTQAALYQAELKRARAQLLNITTGSQLDKLRFNILTSLLRLRQICCHPVLLGVEEKAAPEKPARGKKKAAVAAAAPVESAKLSALMEHLESIIEEEQKVLVFSQFTGMLDLIAAETDARGWKRFHLTGQTEDRGALVNAFQNHEGPAVFLISLKAGGFGLNLTAASYVVLYDPWWNPAVEAQAIDRTHRIGQQQTVFAYRLLVKDSIEEKIRALQKQKGTLAHDILGEENFARALSLDDFRFLLSE